MKDKIWLSFSTIKMLHNESHCWINKQMGIQVPDNEYFKSGRDIEKIVCDHLSGKKYDDRLLDIKYKFPIVQEVKFDPRCQFKFDIDDKYAMIGYVDARNPANLTVGEIKTRKGLWGLSEWKNSLQRKIYGIGFEKYKTFYLLTFDKTDISNHKVYPLEPTPDDRREAMEWIHEGIDIIKSGKYDGGLVDNKCDGFCLYGKSCSFYQS